MFINADYTPLDRYWIRNLADSKQEILLTLGACSYVCGLNVNFPLDDGKLHHALIGRFCSFSDNISFMLGMNHAYKAVSTYPFNVDLIVKKIFDSVKPAYIEASNHYQVVVGHDVWIGNGVTIMGGVKIGNGAVIGAKAVVAKDIPPYAIAAGNPARVVKYRFDKETIKKFLAVKWWNWDLKKLGENLPLMVDVEKFLETHYSPELENFSEDDFSRYLNNFGGGCLYQFIADFRAARPLWIKVVHEFCQSNFEKNLLVIYLGKSATETDLKNLAAEINRFGNEAGKNIFVVNLGEKIFSPAALRKGTHFITTREMTTLEALDYLWGTNVKIVSALDEKIFTNA